MCRLPRSVALLPLLALALLPARAQESVTTKKGEPALQFRSTDDYYTLVIRTEEGGERALRFRVQHWRLWKAVTWGWLSVTPSKMVYRPDAAADADDITDLARREVRSVEGPDAKTGCMVTVRTSARKYDFRIVFYSNDSDTIRVHCLQNGTEKEAGHKVMRWLQDVQRDFAATVARFDRLTLQGSKPAAPAPTAAAANAKGMVVVQSSPGNAQVYLDNRFQGTTSEAGELIIEGGPGQHEVRLTQPGYQEWRMNVWLKAGERQRITATMTPAGPRPLTRMEIGEMLGNNVAKPRIIALVKQYGVDFALTGEAERDLRSKGADSDVLVAIATHKK